MKLKIISFVLIAMIFWGCDESPENPLTLDDISFNPIISFVSPVNGALYSTVDTIQFNAKILDADNVYSEISATWTSNHDGLLYSGKLQEGGFTNFETSSLTYNSHSITLKVSDSDGHTTIDSIRVNTNLPEEVNLFTLEKDYYSINLKWSKYISSDFNFYRIYRYKDYYGSNTQIISTISDINDTTFQDSSVTLGEIYLYEVKVYNQDNFSNGSNVQTESAGFWIDIPYDIEWVIGDDSRNKLYAISRYNGYLYIIDLATLQIENSIYIRNNIFNLTIDAQNDTLFIGNTSYYYIDRIDLNSQTILNPLYLNDRPSSICCVKNGRLVYADFYSSSPLYLINSNSGVQLNRTNSYYYDIDMAYGSINKTIFAGERDYSPQLYKYNITNDSLVYIEETSTQSYYSGNVLLSSDENYVYYARKKWNANNLTQYYYEFPEDIYYLSPDDQIILSEYNIYDTNNYNVIKSLPIPSTVATFLDDKLYLYDQNNKLFVLSY